MIFNYMLFLFFFSSISACEQKIQELHEKIIQAQRGTDELIKCLEQKNEGSSEIKYRIYESRDRILREIAEQIKQASRSDPRRD